VAPGKTVAIVGDGAHSVIEAVGSQESMMQAMRSTRPMRRFLPKLIDRVWTGRIDPGKVFDLTLPLAQVAEGYRAMDERRAIKTLLMPWANPASRSTKLKETTIEYTHLGRTGLKVSRLVLGTLNFGELTDEATSFAIMDEALDAGINFFDTADVYGGPQSPDMQNGFGISEEIIGRWLAQAAGASASCWRSRCIRRWRPGRTIATCRRTTSWSAGGRSPMSAAATSPGLIPWSPIGKGLLGGELGEAPSDVALA
jgi:hypothetical protein